jgi:hypothetical protein
LQCTSRFGKALVEEHYAFAFRTLLTKYFQDVDGFLTVLGDIKGCITGSQALKLIMNDANATWHVRAML